MWKSTLATAGRSQKRLLSGTVAPDRPAVDVLIVGGGAIGLAAARAIGQKFPNKSVFLVEKEKQFGQGTSSRSSEVVHAGIYYPKGSRKAKWCVEGRRALKQFCSERGIEIVHCGKLIVSTSTSQDASLDKIALHAKNNGVGDEPGEALEKLTRDQARRLEPDLNCTAALFSPSTAVLNSYQYMAALEAEALDYEANIVYGSRFVKGRYISPRLFEVEIGEVDTARTETITCGAIVNCAGLYAPDVAVSIVTNLTSHDRALPNAFYCKGNYFKLDGVKNPFKRLIYPIPEAHGLGVHLTINVAGAARFGPDVEWIDKLEKDSYVVNPSRCQSFYAAIRTYWPDLPDDCLVPDYAGIRPKLGPANQPAVDFLVMDESHHKVPGLIHCLGIESPGLTSSLAIGDHLARLVA